MAASLLWAAAGTDGGAGDGTVHSEARGGEGSVQHQRTATRSHEPWCVCVCVCV